MEGLDRRRWLAAPIMLLVVLTPGSVEAAFGFSATVSIAVPATQTPQLGSFACPFLNASLGLFIPPPTPSKPSPAVTSCSTTNYTSGPIGSLTNYTVRS